MVSSKEKNFISIIAYIHNNGFNIEEWLKHLIPVIENHFEKVEIIFVNDYSSDKYIDKIKEFLKKAKYNNVEHTISVINLSYYHGLEYAMNAGIDLAIGDFIYEFDNLSVNYDNELIWKTYELCLQGYDIVSAVPKENTDIFSSMFYKVYNWTKHREGSCYPLQRETFRVLSRRTVNRVKSLGISIPYRKVMYINCGLPCESIYYDILPEKNNYDKAEKKFRKELAVDTLILFTDAITKLSLLVSCFFLGFAVLTGLYTVYVYFGNSRPVEGWTPIMGFLSAAFGGIFIILTIMIKYLSLILNMLFKKQNYLIKSIEKITD